MVLDSTSFLLLVNPQATPPKDPATGNLVTRAAQRFAHLEAQAQRENETILIPTPSLAEVLVKMEEAGPAVVERIAKSARFKIADFDVRAAVEVAAMTREALDAGNKRDGSSSSWQKVKIDRQIIAIARVYGADRIYSDDENLGTFALKAGLRVIRTWEMPLPPEDPQAGLFDQDRYDPQF